MQKTVIINFFSSGVIPAVPRIGEKYTCFSAIQIRRSYRLNATSFISNELPVQSDNRYCTLFAANSLFFPLLVYSRINTVLILFASRESWKKGGRA